MKQFVADLYEGIWNTTLNSSVTYYFERTGEKCKLPLKMAKLK